MPSEKLKHKIAHLKLIKEFMRHMTKNYKMLYNNNYCIIR